MKGIILAAGKGSRISELNLKHKSFAEVKKKRIIDYSLDLLSNPAEGGYKVDEIIIVVGHNAQLIIDTIGKSYNDVPVKYVYQKELKGIAHAVLTAKEALDDDFIMCLADEILLNPRLADMVSHFKDSKAICVCGAVWDGSDFSGKPIGYTVENETRIVGVHEKPDTYHNDIRGIGECVFRKDCLNLLEILEPNPKRGELEMGDWIQMAAKKDNAFVFDLADAYVNVNYAQDLQRANDLLDE